MMGACREQAIGFTKQCAVVHQLLRKIAFIAAQGAAKNGQRDIKKIGRMKQTFRKLRRPNLFLSRW